MPDADVKIDFNIYDHETNEEIEGVNFQGLLCKPSVGEELHYWQDGTSGRAWGESGIRRDFVVKRIVHDLRYMPARGGTRPHYIHMLVLYVTEITA
jgi:hypothetical protein